MYLYDSLRRTGKGISEHKGLFLIILALQLALLLSLGFIGLSYQVKFFQDAQVIMTTIQGANFDAEQIKAGAPFLENFNELYQSYRSLIVNVIYFCGWMAFMFLLPQALLWILVQQLLMEKHSWKNMLLSWGKMWLKYTATAIVLFTPFLIAGYYFLRSLFTLGLEPESFGKILQWVLIFGGVIYYFFMAAEAVMHEHSWKEFCKKWYMVSIRKIYLTLPVLLINIMLIALGVYLMWLVLFGSENFFMIIVLSIVMLVILVLTKIFWCACLREIAGEHGKEHGKEHEKSHH